MQRPFPDRIVTKFLSVVDECEGRWLPGSGYFAVGKRERNLLFTSYDLMMTGADWGDSGLAMLREFYDDRDGGFVLSGVKAFVGRFGGPGVLSNLVYGSEVRRPSLA